MQTRHRRIVVVVFTLVCIVTAGGFLLWSRVVDAVLVEFTPSMCVGDWEGVELFGVETDETLYRDTPTSLVDVEGDADVDESSIVVMNNNELPSESSVDMVSQGEAVIDTSNSPVIDTDVNEITLPDNIPHAVDVIDSINNETESDEVHDSVVNEIVRTAFSRMRPGGIGSRILCSSFQGTPPEGKVPERVFVVLKFDTQEPPLADTELPAPEPIVDTDVEIVTDTVPAETTDTASLPDDILEVSPPVDSAAVDEVSETTPTEPIDTVSPNDESVLPSSPTEDVSNAEDQTVGDVTDQTDLTSDTESLETIQTETISSPSENSQTTNNAVADVFSDLFSLPVTEPTDNTSDTPAISDPVSFLQSVFAPLAFADDIVDAVSDTISGNMLPLDMFVVDPPETTNIDDDQLENSMTDELVMVGEKTETKLFLVKASNDGSVWVDIGYVTAESIAESVEVTLELPLYLLSSWDVVNKIQTSVEVVGDTSTYPKLSLVDMLISVGYDLGSEIPDFQNDTVVSLTAYDDYTIVVMQDSETLFGQVWTYQKTGATEWRNITSADGVDLTIPVLFKSGLVLWRSYDRHAVIGYDVSSKTYSSGTLQSGNQVVLSVGIGSVTVAVSDTSISIVGAGLNQSLIADNDQVQVDEFRSRYVDIAIEASPLITDTTATAETAIIETEPLPVDSIEDTILPEPEPLDDTFEGQIIIPANSDEVLSGDTVVDVPNSNLDSVVVPEF